MTPTRLAECRAILGELSERALARLTGYSPSAVRNWSSGKAVVPEPVAAWLERRTQDWRRDPPPRRSLAGG